MTMAIKGFHEAFSKYQLRGWAYSTGAPSEHLHIVAECRGVEVAKGVANLYREDLARAGIAAGDHAFIINLDRPLSDEELAQLSICAIDQAGERRDLGTPTKSPPAAPAPAAPLQLPFEPTDPSQSPVFVLGAARSGTSALAQGLIRSGWCEGHGEGHIWPLLPRLLAVVRAYYKANGADANGSRNTLLSRIPMTHFTAGVRSLFAQLPRQIYPSGRWVDKTPNVEMITSALILQEIWPSARFVFARRRGIENIVSRLRKFPSVPFSKHCADWAGVMNAWLDVRDSLGPRTIEIEHLDIARNPKGVADTLGAALDMPDECRTRLEQALSFDRPERTATTFAEVESLESVGWSEAEKEEFIRVCGAMIEAYHYTLDKNYRLDQY